MKNAWDKLKSVKRETLIRNSFLLPILLVVIISISHVVSWYDLGNPLAWAIYLSVGMEVFALASISAASINMSKLSVWFLFGLVTSIQIIGNVFFTYNDIDVNGAIFQSWVELISPLFEEYTITDHKRLLALVQGGSLPLMSLTALHFYIKFNDNPPQPTVAPIPAPTDPPQPKTAPVAPIPPIDPPQPKKPDDEGPEDDGTAARFNPQNFL